MALKWLLSFCQTFLHGWSWKTLCLLAAVQLTSLWKLQELRGWWIPASNCSTESSDVPGVHWSRCARAVALCMHLEPGAPGKRHLTVDVHTSTSQPIAAHRDSGPFSGISLSLVKYPAEREGKQNGSVKLKPSCLCWVAPSSLWEGRWWESWAAQQPSLRLRFPWSPGAGVKRKRSQHLREK